MNEFVKATLIRAIRTMAQTAIATIGSSVAVSDVNWQFVVSASILAGILSVLTSIATGLPEVDLVDELDEEDDELDEEDEWYGNEDDMEVDPYEGEETEDGLEEE